MTACVTCSASIEDDCVMADQQWHAKQNSRVTQLENLIMSLAAKIEHNGDDPPQ